MNMKYLLSFFIFLPILSTTVLASDMNSTVDPQAVGVNNTSQRDEKALMILIQINKNEIMLANEIKHKNINAEILNYAKFLDEEHTDNLNMTEHLAQKLHLTPIQSKKSKELYEEGKTAFNNLSSLNNKSLEISYINKMVEGHKAALLEINLLLKNIENPSLKKHFEQTKLHVENHLKQAERIQKELTKSN